MKISQALNTRFSFKRLRLNKFVIRKLKIGNDVSFYIICLLFLFPFFEPRVFFNYPPFHMIDKLYMMCQMISFSLITIRYVLSGRISFGFIGLAMYRLSVLFCTLYSAGTVDNGWFSKTLIILGTMMVLELYIRKDAFKALKCLYIVLIVPIIINLFMCLMGISFASGTTHYYFIGMRTQFPNTMIPAILLSMMLSYMENNTVDLTDTGYGSDKIQLVKEWVGTGLVLIMVLICITYIFIHKPKRLNAPLLFLFTLALNYGIAVCRIQNILSFIIVDMMHKDLTLTGRTFIWDVVIEKISQKPLFGYGELGTGGIVKVYWATRLVPAHNSMLQIIYDGGMVSFAFLLMFILYSCFKLKRHRDSTLACITGIGIALTGVQMFTEVLHYQVYFYIFFMLACNIDHIIKDKHNITEILRYNGLYYKAS